MKTVCVLGSTGSIGTNTLDVIGQLRERFRVVGLSAARNVELLASQANTFDVPHVCIGDEDKCAELKTRLNNDRSIFAGPAGLIELVEACKPDILVAAVMGAAGMEANLRALQNGARLALANKESLVTAGDLFIRVARETKGEIIPVDSEHNALYQALMCGKRDEVRHLILTASGGPFRTRPIETFDTITVEEALKHPTWDMGRKITIDSATMMNKTLEVLEAYWLFGFEPDRIKVVVHPQSLIHSLVEYEDGNIMAQMSVPDMRVPIQFALTHPERTPGPAKKFDVRDFATMTFEPANPDKFPALRLGYRAAEQGGTMGAVLNAANEVAVQRFLDRQIGFTHIPKLVEAAMDRHTVIPHPTLSDVIACDQWAREEARSWKI